MWVYDSNTDELYHYGRKGMKWGQNIFGKVKTAAGNARAKIAEKRAANRKAKAAEALRKKPISKLTEEELKERIVRAGKEKQLFDIERSMSSLEPERVSTGKKLISKFFNEAVIPAAVNAGKAKLTDMFQKRLGIGTDEFAALTKEAKRLGLEKNIAEAKSAIDKLKNSKNDDMDDLANEAKRWGYEKTIYEGKTTKERYNSTYNKPKNDDASGESSNSSSSNSSSKSDNKVYEGTVTGNGTSKKKNKDDKQSSKPDDYYDPINTSFVSADDPMPSNSNALVVSGTNFLRRFY